MAIRVVSWNIATRHKPWRQLLQMDADIALVQEAAPPPEDVARLRDAALPPAEGAGPLDIGPREAWDSHSWNSDWWRVRGWKALFDRWPMVVKLSDRVEVEWFKQISPTRWIDGDEIAASGIGTITAARVTAKDGSIEPFIAISMYGRWMGTRIQASRQRGERATRTRRFTGSSRISRPSSATRTLRRTVSWQQATSTLRTATVTAATRRIGRHATGRCSIG